MLLFFKWQHFHVTGFYFFLWVSILSYSHDQPTDKNTEDLITI